MEQPVKCRDCKNWHGFRHTKWGDCYHVVAHLQPDLMKAKDNFGVRFSTPFDPHAIKYYTRSPIFKKLYNELKTSKTEKGIRRIFMNRSDVAFKGSEDARPCRTTVCFFQTKHNYSCEGGTR